MDNESASERRIHFSMEYALLSIYTPSHLEGVTSREDHDTQHLARIIHERAVNNPGLPGQDQFRPAAGGYLLVGGSGTRPGSRGRVAVSRRTGDA